ncbi:hypothetical protein GCM10009682_41900 [Luedemannella flava]|uniref:DUF2017 domain-containing protein n=1 Tax=Luedemannella flava TaxID=349316 RepID=A0ABN2MAJ5_9ACTN
MFYRDGAELVAHIDRDAAQVLRQCAAQLTELLGDDPDRDDPVVARLFPDMYRNDPEAAAEMRELTEDDLRLAKVTGFSEMIADLPRNGGDVRLTEESADVWVRGLTDMRLALGLRLDIRDDTDFEAEIDDAVAADPTSNRVRQLAVYGYLTGLQGSLVDALMD